MKKLNYIILFILLVSQLAQAQYKYSILHFRVNLKNVESYEFFVADKSVYKATRKGHINFEVYSSDVPSIDLKIVGDFIRWKTTNIKKENFIKTLSISSG